MPFHAFHAFQNWLVWLMPPFIMIEFFEFYGIDLAAWFMWLMPRAVYLLLLLFSMCFANFAYNITHIPHISPKEFEVLGFELLGRNPLAAGSHFKECFGAESRIVYHVWCALYSGDGWFSFLELGFFYKPDPVHLLWALLLLRRYGSDHAMALTAGVSEKNFRKWSWFYINKMANLDAAMIRWENRLCDHSDKKALVSIYVRDYAVLEQFPFDTSFYSHKVQGHALRYEISCETSFKGEVVMFAGPFQCGSWPAAKIFREGLKKMLGPCEHVVAEGFDFYAMEEKVLPADNFTRARIIAFQSRMESWRVLKQVFHHPIDTHPIAFRAVLVVEQTRTLYGDADADGNNVGINVD